MRIIRHATVAPAPTALAIGSFDGVHLGHQVLFAHLARKAASRGLVPSVLTFEPLPREYFQGSKAPPRLSALAEKLHDMSRAGIRAAFVERFDARFAGLTAREFEERIARAYGARWVMVGADFRYGAGRHGNLESLRAAGASRGYEVVELPQVDVGGQRVSSTRVRQALAAADFAQAARLLGRPYTICGRVVHGAKRGRTLGFPTANIRLARRQPALTGVFAVKCYGAATRGLEGVASLGWNPAVQAGGPASLEAFLFDFSGDLYGRRLTLEFHRKLRDEAPFASMDELAAQIRRDCDAARAHFGAR